MQGAISEHFGSGIDGIVERDGADVEVWAQAVPRLMAQHRTQRAFSLPVQEGQRICLYHFHRSDAPRGALVYVHPFAEEMNKSRRMAALQSRALAAQGYAVLQIDLGGCGDSSGEFSDATWDGWTDDVRHAVRWLARETGHTPWLWGLRAGALLCVEAADAVDGPLRFLFWQPSTAGKAVWQQFRRVRLAGEALRIAEPAPLPRKVVDTTSRPEVIAGYSVHPDLASGLSAATLSAPTRLSQSVWLEVSAREDGELLPATQRTIAAWAVAGHAVRARTVPGPAFWQTSEIELAPTLLDATVAQVMATNAEAVCA